MRGRAGVGDHAAAAAPLAPENDPAAASTQELVEFARAARHGWPQRFADNIAAGKTCHAALRVLSNRWVEILWHCLIREVHYDEATHQANRLRGPKSP